MANFTATYSLTELGTKRPFKVRGTGTSQADAEGEAAAKIAMTCGTIVSAKVSIAIAAPADTNASGQYSDAVLVLKKGTTVRALHLENVATTLTDPNRDGKLDPGNALIQAMVAAYRDGSGAGGYVYEDGYWVK